MSNKVDSLKSALIKAKDEFNLATKCLYDILKSFNERLERLEKWIENEKNPPPN